MSKQTVAVVDDHHYVRDSIASLLKAAGFLVEKFESAEQFLTYCEESDGAKLACLVLDVRLPGMSGIELQLELKAREIFMPVILISGHATPDVAEQGRKNGAATLLEKPFDGEILVNEIRNLMDARGPDAQENLVAPQYPAAKARNHKV